MEVESDITTEKKTDNTEATTEVKPSSGVVIKIKNITSLDDRMVSLSGDGKSAAQQYMFLFGKTRDGDTVGIKGSVINDIISEGIYATFKEYKSQDDYDKKPNDPENVISITPDSKFTETISDKASYTLSDLNDLLITITKLE